MQIQTAQFWLKAACAVTAATGLGVAMLSLPQMSAAAGFVSGIVFGSTEPMATPLARVLAAVGGGALAGWAATIWLVVDRLLASDPRLVRAIVLPGVLVWFLVDSAFSLAAGGALNVAGNLVFLAAFAVPLLSMQAAARRAA